MEREFSTGFRVSVPVCLGVVPVGISFGILATQAGLTELQAILMSMTVVAGAAQLMSIMMLGQGTAVATIIMATFFINLRHIVMSSAVMARLRDTPIGKKLLGAFVLCDETFAIFSLSEGRGFPFLLGSNAALYSSWVASTVAGCLMGGALPDVVAKGFGIAFYAAFFAMLIPSVRGNARLMLLVCLTATLNALLQRFIPASWAVVVSMIAGAAVGTKFCTEDDGHAE